MRDYRRWLLVVPIFLFVAVIFSNELYAELKIRVHGRWCGPGVPSSGNPEPVDEIDAACKAHDLAFRESLWPVSEGTWASDADRKLAESMRDFLIDSCIPGVENERGPECDEITERQFIVASGVLVSFTAAQAITLVPEIVDGKLSSIFKLPLSAATSITVPMSLTTKMARKILEDSPIQSSEKLIVLVEGGDLLVEMAIDIQDTVENGIDDVGDVSEIIARKIGKATGLNKPLRECKEELEELLSDPKSLGQKIIDCALPWRWSKC